MTIFEQWEQLLKELIQAEKEVLAQLDVEAVKDILQHTGILNIEEYLFATKIELNSLTFYSSCVMVDFTPKGLFSRQDKREVAFPIDVSVESHMRDFVKSAVKIRPEVAFLTSGEGVAQETKKELEELERLIKKYPKRVEMWLTSTCDK